MSLTEVALPDIASVLRSKNAGPFELTLDIVLESDDYFERVMASDVFGPRLIAELYGVSESDVLEFVPFAAARAFKITLRRPVAAGAFGDHDVYGAQQHAPLLGLKLTI